MKKLLFGIVCVALIFAGYRAEIGTVSVARGDEALHANVNNIGPPTRIPAPSAQPEEELRR